MISEGGVDSSSSEQGPVVGYHIQRSELFGFIKYRTFLTIEELLPSFSRTTLLLTVGS
jgi:hypothetical protein